MFLDVKTKRAKPPKPDCENGPKARRSNLALAWLRTPDRMVWWRDARAQSRPAAVPAAGSTGRFVTGGLDLEQKQWAAILRLVKLEPLKEP
jgi:hypothetical protein